MNSSTALFVVLAAAIGTYAARSSLILLLADRTLPPPVERALQNVGPAVLAALTVSLAVGSDGIASMELAEAAALAVAAAVALWRSNLIWTFVAGMVTLWVVGAIT